MDDCEMNREKGGNILRKISYLLAINVFFYLRVKIDFEIATTMPLIVTKIELIAKHMMYELLIIKIEDTQ